MEDQIKNKQSKVEWDFDPKDMANFRECVELLSSKDEALTDFFESYHQIVELLSKKNSDTEEECIKIASTAVHFSKYYLNYIKKKVEKNGKWVIQKKPEWGEEEVLGVYSTRHDAEREIYKYLLEISPLDKWMHSSEPVGNCVSTWFNHNTGVQIWHIMNNPNE